jgi:excisionase family DNA binding protein
MASTEAAAAYEWLTVAGAAARAKVSRRLIYAAVKAGRLKASRLGVRKDIRILASWVDAWIESMAVVTVINPGAPGEDVPAGAGPLVFTRRGRKAEH